jgi:hypothetical protein
MDREQTKRDLEAKLAQCRRLADAITDGVASKGLHDLAAELEQKIRALGE